VQHVTAFFSGHLQACQCKNHLKEDRRWSNM